MGSDNSRNFEKIVKYFKNKDVTIACLSDNKDSEILKKAQSLDIPNKYLPYERNTQYLAATDFDLIVLSGYNKKLATETLKTGQVINIHPSLIPSFCGNGFYGLHVHEKALERGVKITGATVHFVDEGTDTGPIIYQKAVEVLEGDTPEILQKRVMEQAEWKILPQAINDIANGKIAIGE